MKKVLSVLLLLSIAIAACSCGNSGSDETLDTTISETVVTTTTNETAKQTTKDTTKETTQETSATTTTIDYNAILASMTLENFPRVDGSTATIPLFLGYIQALTGCSAQEAETLAAFTTTDPSYYALRDGNADLLLVYAPSQATDAELDVWNTMNVQEIGLDALVFIVNEDNPIDSLTSDQIRDIYSGKITNWKDVGGEDLPIMAFQRPEQSGSQTLMLELMMKDTPMVTPTTEVISSSMADLIDDVSAFDNSANAIGYSVYYYAKNMYTQPGLKFIAVDDVLPSNETINDQSYGYTHPFYGIIPKEPTPEAEALLAYIQSPDGQKILEACGYVPISKVS